MGTTGLYSRYVHVFSPRWQDLARRHATELSNNIMQKGLAFGRDWSGTVTCSGRHGRLEILPRRLVGRDGASVVRHDAAMNRTEDLNVEVYEEAAS
jgi:hypothetical protein